MSTSMQCPECGFTNFMVIKHGGRKTYYVCADCDQFVDKPLWQHFDPDAPDAN